MLDMSSELRSRRLSRGLSVSETARRAGITRAYLHRLENGAVPSNPSFEVLDRLATTLGAPTADDLAGRRDRRIEAQSLPDSLRRYAQEAELDSTGLAPLAALAPFADRDARPAEWALVHEILVHTILAKDVERRGEAARARP
jgi:transcriptional regulator with XRE-family HTH domain